MKGGVGHEFRASRAWVSSLGVLIVALTAGGLAAGGARKAEAATLQVSWNAPTTNADGTPLRDLDSYRIYIGTTQPACPGTSFHPVPSPTATPAPGQTVSQQIAALTAGATYFLRITAVDDNGNESACSPAVSGVARMVFDVTPSTATNFGSVALGSSVDLTFTVRNASTTSLAGTASVGAPFSIVSGGSFSLSPGASQTLTVRFRPTTAGTFAGNVTFTAGGETLSRAVIGAVTGATGPTLSVAKNGTGAGMVNSSPAGIACGTDCTQTASAGARFTLTASAAAGSTFAGWGGACTGTAACVVTLNAAQAVTATFNPSSAPPPAPAPASAPAPVVRGTSPASPTSTVADGEMADSGRRRAASPRDVVREPREWSK
jgi:hypothetical protein